MIALPGAAAAAGRGFFAAVAAVMRSGIFKYTAGVATGGSVVADVLDLNFFRRETVRVAPGATEQGIEEVAKTAARMMGLGQDDVLWPIHRRGPNQGKSITPVCFVLNLHNGRAWFTSSVPTTRKRGSFRRFGYRRRSYGSRGPQVQINKG